MACRASLSIQAGLPGLNHCPKMQKAQVTGTSKLVVKPSSQISCFSSFIAWDIILGLSCELWHSHFNKIHVLQHGLRLASDHFIAVQLAYGCGKNMQWLISFPNLTLCISLLHIDLYNQVYPFPFPNNLSLIHCFIFVFIY